VHKGSSIKGCVLVAGKDTYYDIQITDSFAVFFDCRNDTVVQAYKKDDFSKLCHWGFRKDGEKGFFINPKFTKSDTLNKKNHSLLMTDNYLIREIRLDIDREGEILPLQTYSLPSNLVYGTNHNLTSSAILGVPFVNNANKLFYFYESELYYWVKPEESILPQYFSSVSNVYLTNLCANEKENSIVSALRFINCIQFYDFDTELITSVIIGDSILLPQINTRSKETDILNTAKYIIDIYGTSDYVYCLYNGSRNYDVNSTIFVFKWNGKHISTLKTDRSIKKIAVDSSDKYLIALGRNEKEGYDVVKYTLSVR
jgi:hypothetical protein